MSDAPPTTTDTVAVRQKQPRRVWRIGCLSFLAGIAFTVGAFMLFWWLVAPGGLLHAWAAGSLPRR